KDIIENNKKILKNTTPQNEKNRLMYELKPIDFTNYSNTTKRTTKPITVHEFKQTWGRGQNKHTNVAHGLTDFATSINNLNIALNTPDVIDGTQSKSENTLNTANLPNLPQTNLNLNAPIVQDEKSNENPIVQDEKGNENPIQSKFETPIIKNLANKFNEQGNISKKSDSTISFDFTSVYRNKHNTPSRKQIENAQKRMYFGDYQQEIDESKNNFTIIDHTKTVNYYTLRDEYKNIYTKMNQSKNNLEKMKNRLNITNNITEKRKLSNDIKNESKSIENMQIRLKQINEKLNTLNKIDIIDNDNLVYDRSKTLSINESVKKQKRTRSSIGSYSSLPSSLQRDYSEELRTTPEGSIQIDNTDSVIFDQFANDDTYDVTNVTVSVHDDKNFLVNYFINEKTLYENDPDRASSINYENKILGKLPILTSFNINPKSLKTTANNVELMPEMGNLKKIDTSNNLEDYVATN